MTYYLIGSWAYSFDGFTVRRISQDGSESVARQVRQVPEAPHARRELRRTGLLNDSGAPRRARKFGALCVFSGLLEEAGQRLEASGEEVVFLDWNLGERPEWARGVVSSVPSIVEIDGDGQVASVLEVRQASDLAPGNLTGPAFQRRRDAWASLAAARSLQMAEAERRRSRMAALVSQQDDPNQPDLSVAEVAELTALIAKRALNL